MPSNFQTVCVIIVIRDRLQDLEQCLKSLRQHLTEHDTVFLWDNHSQDSEQLTLLASQFKEYHWNFSKENLGFTGGNHQGICWAQEQKFDVVFLLNPDTKIQERTLQELRVASAQCHNRWILGPLLLHPENTKAPVIDSAGLKLDFLYRAQDQDQGIALSKLKFKKKIVEVSGLCGAALWIPLSLFPIRKNAKKQSLFDETYFVYFEDVELSLYWKNQGGHLGLAPRSQVFHNRGGASKLRYLSHQDWKNNPMAIRGSILNRYRTMVRYERDLLSLLWRHPALPGYELLRWSYLCFCKPFLRPLMWESLQVLKHLKLTPQRPEKKETQNRNRVKILQISGRSDLSGGPISMLRLIQELDPERFVHVVLCPDNANGIQEELRTCPNCTVIPMTLRSLNPGSLLRILRILCLEPFDLIHSHGKAAGLYSRIAGRLSGVPVIHQFHGLHYRQYPKPLQPLYFALERYLAHWSDALVCVSHSEKKEGLRENIFIEKQVTVIHNGIDGERFTPSASCRKKLREQLGIPEAGRVILSITRNNYQKNIEKTLEVYELLCQRYPDVYLVLAGISDEDSSFGQISEFLSCRNQVILLQDEPRMHEWINIADCYLNTSRWEGFSVGLVEALAMQLPAVISNVTGNQDFQELTNEGVFFVELENTEGYVSEIMNFFNTPQDTRRVGASARNHVLHHFNLRSHVACIENLYLRHVK